MFDWFREVAEELSGIDSAAAKKERMEKREQKKLDRFIFSRGAKATIIVLGLLYIIMTVSTLGAVKNMSANATGVIVKSILMSILAIVVIFALLIGKKKGEIVALVGTFIFVVGVFLSTILI